MNPTKIECFDRSVNPKVFESVQRCRRGCPFECPYCYLQKFPDAWVQKWQAGFYPERIAGKMKEKSIFVESIGDLFHPTVPLEEQVEVLERCGRLDESNTVVIVSKNPEGYGKVKDLLQNNFVLGFTMETDVYPDGFNPRVKQPMTRAEDFLRLRWEGESVIFVEPLMEMRSKIVAFYLEQIHPTYTVFGLNSVRDVQLPEPSYEAFRFLVSKCYQLGIRVIIKNNMGRWGVKPIIEKIRHSVTGAQDGVGLPKKRLVQRTLC